ncbi:MAG TPA: pyridoxal-phosphate dependent enzyme [Acidimicrobiia bacterium]|nr:pyridoxal-phosphate dependent enzyme [Acidimicrobiia bacterium]
MIDVDEEVLRRAAARAAERGVVIPTFAQMIDPSGQVPDVIARRLRRIGLWDLDPLNLFRITWHNQPVAEGGGFGSVNWLEVPPSLSGVDARIVALVGKWFPTGAHKVGAAFGCLVPRLVTGGFDPTTQKAVWPSTGNYCRGGAFDSHLLACESVAILPEGMSQERFDWLSSIAGEVIKTPGSESNVKEIFDKCHELRASGEDVVIFNQFDEPGNYLWHYAVTGPALLEAAAEAAPGVPIAGLVLATGSAGTIASGDHIKQHHPSARIAAAEALQCPTMLLNGYGSHRIEGIGDKHIPWIHNVRNTDDVIAVDDTDTMAGLRLFNERAGRKRLADAGVPSEFLTMLPLFGISGIANLQASIKFARMHGLGADEVVLTVLTDSVDLYRSRLQELREDEGPFGRKAVDAAYERALVGQDTSNMAVLDDTGRRRIHNLKYYTWVEQQGKAVEELDAQWDDPGYWTRIQEGVADIDRLIVEFNARAASS